MVNMWVGRKGRSWRSEVGFVMGFCRGIGKGDGGVGKCILSCYVCYLLKFFFLFLFFSSHTMGFACRESQAILIFFPFFFSFTLLGSISRSHSSLLVLVMMTTTLTAEKKSENKM